MVHMADKKYDVIIVGAGPGGLFAAYELCNNSKLSVLLIEKGSDVSRRVCPMNKGMPCAECDVCSILSGIGGAGGMSDGKLNLDPCIGGDVTRYTGSRDVTMQLIEQVSEVFTKFGAPTEILFDKEKAKKLLERAAKAGVRYLPVKQRHVGSDNLPGVISKFKKYLEEKKVDFMLNTEVVDLDITEDGKTKTIVGIKLKDRSIKADKVILAPGREGESWFINMAKRYGVHLTNLGIDIGVRVETNYHVMKELTDVNWDPKIHIFTDRHDDFVRTFCTNPMGYIAKEVYNGYIGVNGHAMAEKKSENTNFALLVRMNLTEPVEDTHQYGKSIAHLATTIGGGKPILQRLGDLKKGRRSTWARIERGFVNPTMKDVTPGDISMALPGRVVANIVEGLAKLDKLVAGINSDSTLLYAPEIKYYSMRAALGEGMASAQIKNLFFVGDGAGLTRGIVNASATGIWAARNIISKTS